MAHRILVASYTNDIVTLLFDPAAKTLSVEASLAVGYRPSWVTPYPGDNSLIFTGLEQSDGKVVAIKFDYENKKAEVVKEVQSAGADPCSLLATEDQLFVANVRFSFFIPCRISYLHLRSTIFYIFVTLQTPQSTTVI